MNRSHKIALEVFNVLIELLAHDRARLNTQIWAVERLQVMLAIHVDRLRAVRHHRSIKKGKTV